MQRPTRAHQHARTALVAVAVSLSAGVLAEDLVASTPTPAPTATPALVVPAPVVPPASAATSLDAQLAAEHAALASEQARKQELSETRRRLPGVKQALERALVRDVRALYRLRRGGLLPIMGGVDAWIGHAARVAQLERMTARALTALQRRSEEEAALARALEQNTAKLLESTRAIAALEQARAKRAQQEASALRLAAAAPAEGDRMQYGLSLSAAESGDGFERERGALAPPVPGAGRGLIMSGADPRSLALGAPAGTRVRAAAGGRVTFADRHPRHGLLVIVDHGGGYRTLYGGLAAVDVEVGDALSNSTALGTAGSDPVQFEVRHGTHRLDARVWLGS